MGAGSSGVLVADVVPHGVEPVACLLDVELVGGVAAVLGVAEHQGVFAHQVIHDTGAAGELDVVLDDRVEAEEGFLAVEDVELEQRRGGVRADLRRLPGLIRPMLGEFLDAVGDGAGVPGGEAWARSR